MERLTKKHYGGNGYYMACSEHCNKECFDCKEIDKIIDRLAAYEDTGVEPEDLKRAFNETAILKLAAQALSTTPDHLRDIIKAEQDGRLVILPSKTVWELTWDAGPDCDLVCPVSVDGNGCCDFCDNGKLFVYERPCTQERLKELGKTVFLTREEAEAVLKGGDSPENRAD